MIFFDNGLVNFDNSEEDPIHEYSGSDRKEPRLVDGVPFMVKYSDKRARIGELDTSYVNNTLSEYIGSHLAAIVGLPAHKTYLGIFHEELVVGCENFLNDYEVSHEFSFYMRKKYDSSEIGRLPKYEQIYDVIKSDSFLKGIQEDALQRYWDTFVFDAWIANFDRHKGNWAYIYNRIDKSTRPAPVYGCGSTLYPALSEIGMQKVMSSEYEIRRRIHVFPNAALLLNGAKVGYYEMMASGFDNYCTASVKRIVPRIDMIEAERIINNTPAISNVRKQFYIRMLRERKERILDRAYKAVISGNFDLEARDRILNKKPFTDLMLIEEMKREGKQIVKVDCGDVEENIDNTSKRKALKRGKGL